MRPLIVALVLALFQMGIWEASCPAWSQSTEKTVTIYDPNPTHLWNRLHSVLFIRTDIRSTNRVPDALDPPLWHSSSYLLAKPSHERVLRILDEFLQNHGEKLIRDPAKRAMLQRDLWAVFDWSVEREPERPQEADFEKEKQELQWRLSEVMRRVALSPEEIRALPSNYEQAVASEQFGKEYDSQHPERPFLPPRLFDPHGDWVQIVGLSSGPLEPQPLAPSHAEAFSRSTFLILMRIPGGRRATFDYLATLWDLPEPWVAQADDPQHQQTKINPVLPQFPAGTEVALVRQMILFDNRGRLEATPITESLQFRVYRAIAVKDRVNAANASGMAEAVANSGQNFYQIVLSRTQLFANKSGGLRATEPNEKEFAMFGSFGADQNGNPSQYMSLDQYQPVLQTCFVCHRAAGINSVNSRSALLKPNWLQHDEPGAYSPENPWWQYEEPVWKLHRYEWGLLNGYWKAGNTSR